MATNIHAGAIVSPAAEIGEDVQIGPFCTIGPDVTIHDKVELTAHVSVDGHTTIGAGTKVYPFAALGHAPQDNKYREEPTRLTIGERNVIREHVSMHRGSITGRSETRVGERNLFMVGSHVGHDCIVGDRATFANNATLGGMVVIADNVTLGGLSAVHQFGRVGQGAFIGGGAPVTGDVIPYGMVDNHGRLNGLNLIGLQRRGVDRASINALRSAYRQLFTGPGHFSDRLEMLAQYHSDNPQVMEILNFIHEGRRRPLCMPKSET